MPRVDFTIWDRVFFLKIMATAQMTYSSFIVLLYGYLLILQVWTVPEDNRKGILTFKWTVCGMTALEFGLGTLLAFAANMKEVRRRRGVVAWVALETILIPVSICLLMQLYYRLINSTAYYSTDLMYTRTSIAQVCLLLCQYPFIGYAFDFLTHAARKPKVYDPSIRPESVYAPTYPKITTTESRHIRMSQSFFSSPSTSKNLGEREYERESGSSSSKENESWTTEEKMPGRKGEKHSNGDEDWIKMDNDVVWLIDEYEDDWKELKYPVRGWQNDDKEDRMEEN